LSGRQEIVEFFERHGREAGEVILNENWEFTLRDATKKYGEEFIARFLLFDAGLDTTEVTQKQAENIHRQLLKNIQLFEEIVDRPECMLEYGKLFCIAKVIDGRAKQVEQVCKCVVNFLKKLRTEKLLGWLRSKHPFQAYVDLMHADALYRYDKSARLFVKFIGHTSLGLGLISVWRDRLGEFPVPVDGHAARALMTLDVLRAQLSSFIGGDGWNEYLSNLVCLQKSGYTLVCAIALLDPLQFYLFSDQEVTDPIAFENGLFRFGKEICKNDLERRKCDQCRRMFDAIGGISCSKRFRSYGEPREFRGAQANFMEYQREVTCLLRENGLGTTLDKFSEEFEKVFARPISPSLAEKHFSPKIRDCKYLPLLKQQRDFMSTKAGFIRSISHLVR